MKRMLLSVTVALLLVGCGDYININVPKTDIVAVYYHERERYSVAIKNDKVLTIRQIPSYYGRVPIKIIADTEPGVMWYTCQGTYDNWDGSFYGSGCEIHVSSIDDINTGGWGHGKFGYGNTTRLF
jgi:hypothetical protein